MASPKRAKVSYLSPKMRQELNRRRVEDGLPPLPDPDEPPRVTSNKASPVTSFVTSNPPPEPPVDASKLVTPRTVPSNTSKPVTSKKGNRSSKSKAQWNNRLDAEVVRQFQRFCVDHGLTQQEFTEMAGLHYIQTVTSNKVEGVTSLLAHDDRRMMIAWNTELNIINLYLQYNPKNRWTARDDRLGVAYNGTDLRLVEMGMIDTQLNAGLKRIHTFDYYRGQIDLWVEQSPPAESLDMLLTIARRRLEKAREGK